MAVHAGSGATGAWLGGDQDQIGLGSALYVEEDVAVDRFRQAYHQLNAIALDGKESAALIVAAIKEL